MRRGRVLAVALLLVGACLGASAPARAGIDDAITLLAELIPAVEAAGLPGGLERSLTRKLENAKASLERGHVGAALGQLGAVRRQVLAQRGKALTADQADGALEALHVILIAIDPGPAPVLKNLLVTFGPWDPVTNLAGDFVFEAAESKVFLEFGVMVPTPEGPKVLPTFEYRLSPDATVQSPIDGTVDRLDFQADTNDYEIHLTSSPTSPFVVVVDHVTELAVVEGQVVTAGQPLGKPGPFGPTLGRTELQVFNFVEGLNICPFELFAPALAPTFQAQVTNLMADWEAFKADATIYDEAAMVSPGCLVASLPDAP
jgi:hypothetical protein